jgi:TIR domain-containing protein
LNFQIFLSYTSRNRQLAEALHQHLEASKLPEEGIDRVHVVLHESASGAEQDPTFLEQLRDSQIFLLLLARDYIDWSGVDQQISLAQERRIEIIPVATENMEIPESILNLNCFHVYQRTTGESGLQRFLINRVGLKGGHETSLMAVLVTGAVDLLYDRSLK